MHFKTLKMIATSDFLTAQSAPNSFSAGTPDPAGEAHDAPPDPLVGWGGGYPLPIPPPRRLRRLGLVANGDSTSRLRRAVVDPPPSSLNSAPNAWGCG